MSSLRLFLSILMGLSALAVSCANPGLPGSLSVILDKFAQCHGLLDTPLLVLPLRQAWRAQPEAGFAPGRVRLYATDEGFVVLAVLEDASIHNGTDGFNQKTWENGDVFECFIETGAGRYYEVHVTPENQNLFLRWSPESYRAFRANEVSFESALIDDRSFARSETEAAPGAGFWTVYLLIPYASLGLDIPGGPMDGDRSPRELRFSFARYDTGPGAGEPVLSATPEFPEANYHLRTYWHPVTWPPEQVDINARKE